MKISVSHGHLEATIREPDGTPRGAAVVCHPHPQHGGTMHTKAVFRTAQALNEVGIRVLRFNFRGVGTSTGEWDGGVGEKEDVRAALDWMASEEPDLPLVLAGFSFGSRMGLEVAGRDSRVRALVGLGLPVAHYDFEFLRDLDRPLLV
ncbi:MAG: alpha/beta hydrolase, partial [Longimicrobiales bacterium]